MEVAWEDRGKIAYDEYNQSMSPNIWYRPFSDLHVGIKKWWNRVYDACVATEILHKSSGSPDGGMIKIVVTKEKKEIKNND